MASKKGHHAERRAGQLLAVMEKNKRERRARKKQSDAPNGALPRAKSARQSKTLHRECLSATSGAAKGARAARLELHRKIDRPYKLKEWPLSLPLYDFRRRPYKNVSRETLLE
jgi:hypothetical protein